MEIITERLVLRDFVFDDWPAVLEYQRDPRYLQYYSWTGRTVTEVQEFVQMFLDQQLEQPRRKFQLAATLPAENGRVIGNCGIRLKDGKDWEADMGYEIAPEYWGRGYATEAALAVVTFGLTQLGVHRISSWCIADNVASARVLEKVGLKLEGRLREDEYFKGRWWDTLVYGLLENEVMDRPGNR